MDSCPGTQLDTASPRRSQSRDLGGRLHAQTVLGRVMRVSSAVAVADNGVTNRGKQHEE